MGNLQGRHLPRSRVIRRNDNLSGRFTTYPTESQVIYRPIRVVWRDYKPWGGIIRHLGQLQAVCR